MSVKEKYQETSLRFDRGGFQKSIEAYCMAGLKQFKKIIRSYVFFHLFFLGLLVTEIIAFSLSLTFLSKSALIAFSLAGIILTAFAYLVILFYFQAKKPEQFIELRNWFMLLCKKNLPKSLASSEYHLSLANSAYRFASHLMKHETSLYTLPPTSHSLNTLMRKFTNFCHQKDLHKMKEILLLVSITEHIQLIKKMPTDLEAHASLANTYIALSKIYQGDSKDMQEKFKATSEKAIQEFKILDHYSPNDPWIQAQLASCYHDLKMFREEILYYENILNICPDDKQILFRLGILYFQQGLNGKGLRIYKMLKEMGFSRSEELIDYYDANIKREYTGS
jgi:tetratricopeptide (TPR) repeat protein